MNATVRRLSASLVALSCAALSSAQGDAAVLERIVHEGIEHSQVMATLETLSLDIGPRLTGSAAMHRANTWTRDEFRRLGLRNAHLAKWGEIPVRFDRGPSYARMVAPETRELEFTARAWSAGTEGPVRGPVFLRPATMDELLAVADDLQGGWILQPYTKPRGRGAEETPEEEAARLEQEEIDAAFEELGIAGTLSSSRDELVHTTAASGWRQLTMETLPEDVDVRIRLSDFEALKAALEAGETVEVEVDLAHHFTEGPFPVFNTIAEIPGTERPEEVVILSAHLDSWDGPGTQATQDNGTGCAVMLEAARILMDAGARPKRTIRFALWGGEEQGLLGSRSYVDSLDEEERARISAVFVDDGGTNYQGGLVCIESMRPMLEAAVEPVRAAFPDYELTVSVNDRMPRGGGSDHSSFNRAGIPGFYWKETGSGGAEGKDYNFVHHTQNDTMRYVVPDYLVQSATCSAIVAYQLAQADELLPRQPPGDPEPKGLPEDPTFRLTQSPFSGRWDAQVVDEDMPDISFLLELATASDGRLRGKLEGQQGVRYISEGNWDAERGTATFTASSDYGPMAFEVRLEEAEALSGAFEVGGRAIALRAERVPVEPTQLTGHWKGVITSMDAEIRMVFEVAADGTVSGRFQSSQSDSPLFAGRWDAATRKLSFEYDYVHAGRLPVSAELVGDTLVGTINENLEFEARRTEPPAGT